MSALWPEKGLSWPLTLQVPRLMAVSPLHYFCSKGCRSRPRFCKKKKEKKSVVSFFNCFVLFCVFLFEVTSDTSKEWGGID